MVSRALSGVALMLTAAALASCATRDCSPGSEFEPSLCAVQLPAVSQITMRDDAAPSPQADGEASCDDFALSESQLRMYLSAAQQADPGDIHHTLDWSPCHAVSDVRFSDGRVGQLTVSQSRVGSLTIEDDEPLTLYCPRCRFSPFK